MKAVITRSFSQSASSAARRVLTVFSAHACGEYLPWSCCCLWGILTLDLLLLLENTYLGPAVACREYLPWTCCCYWRILTLNLLLPKKGGWLQWLDPNSHRCASRLGCIMSLILLAVAIDWIMRKKKPNC